MLWKDLQDTEGCDDCPLLEREICPGGFACYGSKPVEPPCCGFDDDTDLDEWINEYYKRMRAHEEYETKKFQEERRKKERAQKAADTRQEMRSYCMSEILEVQRAEEALQRQKNTEDFASGLAEAINFANEMFRYSERVVARPEISEKVKRLETELAQAKQKYEAKRKEFYSRRKRKPPEGLF